MSDSPMTDDAHVGQEFTAYSTRPWVRHYEEGVPAKLDIPEQPLTWLLDQTVSNHPSHTAFIYYGTKLTYAQFSSLANRFAAGLQRLGVQKGDRVAIALPIYHNRPTAQASPRRRSRDEMVRAQVRRG